MCSHTPIWPWEWIWREKCKCRTFKWTLFRIRISQWISRIWVSWRFSSSVSSSWIFREWLGETETLTLTLTRDKDLQNTSLLSVLSVGGLVIVIVLMVIRECCSWKIHSSQFLCTILIDWSIGKLIISYIRNNRKDIFSTETSNGNINPKYFCNTVYPDIYKCNTKSWIYLVW